ncbi:MAG: hypothetical protein ACRD2T_05650, partial [Thermoanaerobaculia bacterium]
MGAFRRHLPLRGGAAALVLGMAVEAFAHELRLGDGRGIEPQAVLTLITDAEVQGLVAAFDWDQSLFHGLDLVPAAALGGADLVVRRIEAGFMVMGVVLDTDGSDGEVIRPGTTALATARFRCVAPPA